MAVRKLIDELHHISAKRGDGQLRREVWVDEEGTVTRYNLAYVNHDLFQGDNGRVVGYDNRHGVHHRHYRGKISTIEFKSFEQTEQMFEHDWTVLRKSR